MSDPNNQANMIVVNNSGAPIADVHLEHSYDHDLYDYGDWPFIGAGKSSDDYEKGKKARYWTGNIWKLDIRTGSDYWILNFKSEGRDWTQVGLAHEALRCFTLHDANNGKTVSFNVESTTKDINAGEIVYRKDVIIRVEGSEPHTFHMIGTPSEGGPEAQLPDSAKRPFYLIAHECNQLGNLNASLQYGANGIECDVCYGHHSTHGPGWYVRHENFGEDLTSIDNFSDGIKLSDWLQEAHTCAQNFGERFAVIIFDIKTPKEIAKLQDEVSQVFPRNQSSVNIIFSTGELKNADCLDVVSTSDNQGVAVDYHNNPSDVQRYFNQKGVKNFWYGNGITEKLPETSSIPRSLENAVYQRDMSHGIPKVYAWTYEDEGKIAQMINDPIVSIDGMLVSQGPLIEAVVLQITRHKISRLARRSDKAFVVFRPQ